MSKICFLVVVQKLVYMNNKHMHTYSCKHACCLLLAGLSDVTGLTGVGAAGAAPSGGCGPI